VDAVHIYLIKIKKSHREINFMVISDPSYSHNCIKIYAFYFLENPPGTTSSASNDQSQPAHTLQHGLMDHKCTPCRRR